VSNVRGAQCVISGGRSAECAGAQCCTCGECGAHAESIVPIVWRDLNVRRVPCRSCGECSVDRAESAVSIVRRVQSGTCGEVDKRAYDVVNVVREA
jgi:hypothetical protein